MAGRFRRLRGVDRMYLALETSATPMHFGALVVLDGATLTDDDGRLRLAEVRRTIERRVAAVPELRRAIRQPGFLAGGPLWVDDPAFLIDRHVSEARIPPPPGDGDDGDDGDDALLRFVETLMAPPLDRSHPLWRMWCIGGLSGGRVAVLFAIHHALADGLEAMRLARAVLTDSPPGEGPGGPTGAGRPKSAGVPPSWRDLLLDNARGLAAAIPRLAHLATWRPLAEVARSFRSGWSATRDEPRTSLNGRVGPRRRLAVLRLDQRAARRLARAHGAGVNELVLALVAAGVGALLASRGEPLGRMTARAGVAVALPPADRGDAGNHFGSYVVPLPIREDDPVARRRLVSEAWGRAKATQAVSGVTGVRVWTTRFPPTRALMGRQRFINVMETYLPGPPRPIALLGATVRDLVPIQPLGRNVGLTFLASSYAGRLTIAVRTDPDLFPDLGVLMAAMEHEWDALDGTPEATDGPEGVRHAPPIGYGPVSPVAPRGPGRRAMSHESEPPAYGTTVGVSAVAAWTGGPTCGPGR